MTDTDTARLRELFQSAMFNSDPVPLGQWAFNYGKTLLDAADERDALRSELAELRKPSVASLYAFQAGLGEADDVLDELEKLRARVAELENRLEEAAEQLFLLAKNPEANPWLAEIEAILNKDPTE